MDEVRAERKTYITKSGARLVERVVDELTGEGGPLYEECKDGV